MTTSGEDTEQPLSMVPITGAAIRQTHELTGTPR